MSKQWWPALRLQQEPSTPYGIIVLNQPLNKNALNAIIQNATLLVCADAGADRLMNYDRDDRFCHRLPDAVVGDLDSVTDEAVAYYRSRSVEIAHRPDQYSTDFTKCLKWMRQRFDRQSGDQSRLDVLVIGGLGGRVDQGFSQIHHLYMVANMPELLRGDIYLFSEQSLTFLLHEGINEIHVGRDVFDESCGVLPVAGRTIISMTGFEWDVHHWPTEFGGQLSTSQHLKADLVKIEVCGPRPLFTLELAKSLQATI